MAELIVAGALTAGGGVGAVYGVRHVRATLAAHSLAAAAATSGPLPARDDLSTLPDLRVALESSGTFLGMSDELLLDREVGERELLALTKRAVDDAKRGDVHDVHWCWWIKRKSPFEEGALRGI